MRANLVFDKEKHMILEGFYLICSQVIVNWLYPKIWCDINKKNTK